MKKTDTSTTGLIVSEELDGKIFRIRIDGKLDETSFELINSVVERLIEKHGTINMICHLEDFEGWTPQGLLEDLRFDMRHYSHFDRVAIIGDRKWKKLLSMIAKPFTKATVRFFDATDIEAANNWIRSDL